MFLQKQNDVLLSVKVVPNSRRNEVICWLRDELKIKISAAPENGKANKELISFLAERLELPKHQIHIIKGEIDCRKLLKIERITTSEVAFRLWEESEF